MSLERDADRGRMASEVLDNPVYAESYALVEQELTKKWLASRDAHEREQLHQLAKALKACRTVLESTMRSGKVASKELERRRSLPERVGMTLRRFSGA